MAYVYSNNLSFKKAWNPHKMIGAPLQSNIFVTQKPGLLAQCNSASASYLFQQDKFYDVSYDTGDKSVQCGRKVDAFQVWFMLKIRGERYFCEAVENAFDQVLHVSYNNSGAPVGMWTCPHQVLAATLTLSQPGADYAHPKVGD